MASTHHPPLVSGISTPTPTNSPTVLTCLAACVRLAAKGDGRQTVFWCLKPNHSQQYLLLYWSILVRIFIIKLVLLLRLINSNIEIAGWCIGSGECEAATCWYADSMVIYGGKYSEAVWKLRLDFQSVGSRTLFRHSDQSTAGLISVPSKQSSSEVRRPKICKDPLKVMICLSVVLGDYSVSHPPQNYSWSRLKGLRLRLGLDNKIVEMC